MLSVSRPLNLSLRATCIDCRSAIDMLMNDPVFKAEYDALESEFERASEELADHKRGVKDEQQSGNE